MRNWILLSILLWNSDIYSQINSPLIVPIGDTTRIGWISPPGGVFSGDCIDFSYDFTHLSGTDFFYGPLYNPGTSPPGKEIFFSPHKIGVQFDTCTSSFASYHHRSGGLCDEQFFHLPVRAIGISDSISAVFFLTNYWYDNILYPTTSEGFQWVWDSDSNRYSEIFKSPFEIINNITDSTTFSFKLIIDSTAHIQTMITLLNDSSTFPNILFCKPWTRRLLGNILFNSDSKGFVIDTLFKSSLYITIHNSSKDDTIVRTYELSYKAKPTVSVQNFQNIEFIHINSLLNSPFVRVN